MAAEVRDIDFRFNAKLDSKQSIISRITHFDYQLLFTTAVKFENPILNFVSRIVNRRLDKAFIEYGTRVVRNQVYKYVEQVFPAWFDRESTYIPINSTELVLNTKLTRNPIFEKNIAQVESSFYFTDKATKEKPHIYP